MIRLLTLTLLVLYLQLRDANAADFACSLGMSWLLGIGILAAGFYIGVATMCLARMAGSRNES